jgi:hypothetical protein
MRIVVLAFAVLAASGCATLSSFVETAPPMNLYLDEDAMKAEVLHHVRLGMPVEEAEEFMQKNGFQCHYGRDMNAVEKRDQEHMMFCLLCSKYKPQPSWLEGLVRSDEILVYVVFEQGQVTNVLVKHFSCCL